ncbi:MAG: [acyl-carrier-protein] S-malonyltransferase [Candidatus Anoxymicrobium japonicum]|uniref:Malonyl CoA-acyl carrier protein transacylase n=1 Tax=Candidatus Anoxymicrobium japonicum TaxID=2013648 RepID=A0A2N3G574_9ACTN|nr:MAG: [acyl-carrier-protein] S-malonyltransferase [Candidatus Anoxymicrobium japonicum]
MNVAFVFPGQGSQCRGMGRELALEYPAARGVFDLADETLDFDVSTMCWGEDERINQTEFTQPALLTAELACLGALLENGIKPSMTAGHSLGEYGALVAAGAIDVADALALVRARGKITSETARKTPGKMAAVIGMEADALGEFLKAASKTGILEVSNYNAPGQVVLSGELRAVDEAARTAKSFGAKRIVELAISGPFHSSLMKPAAKKFATEVEAARIRNASAPVISNFDAEPHEDARTIGRNLVSQLFHPVRWEESVDRMSQMGADLFLEVGPGHVLAGLIRRRLPGARVIGVGSTSGVAEAVEALKMSNLKNTGSD